VLRCSEIVVHRHKPNVWLIARGRLSDDVGLWSETLNRRPLRYCQAPTPFRLSFATTTDVLAHKVEMFSAFAAWCKQ
jgi:hypothetical protein